MNVFIIANLTAILFVNRPLHLSGVMMGKVECNSPQLAYRLRWMGYGILRYASFVGLDNRWQMFGRQSRFNWWYVVSATYADKNQCETVRLPIPSQSRRTLYQRCVTDFREAKFALNIYANQGARESYSRYLARQYPRRGNLPLRTITWQLAYQPILSPTESVTQRRLWSDHCYLSALDEFPIVSPSPAPAEIAGGHLDERGR